MSYLSKRFPALVAPNPAGGPAWSTDVATTLVGDEQRNQNWQRSRHEYDVSPGIKSTAQFKEVGAHFRMARGKLHVFRFKDWGDFAATRSEGSAIAITSSTFQLVKNYGDVLDFVEQRLITRPINGSLVIWKDGSLLATPSDFTYDPETGIITFASSPGAAVLETSFQFDVPVRYDTDVLKATVVMADSANGASYLSWESVPLIEDRDQP